MRLDSVVISGSSLYWLDSAGWQTVSLPSERKLHLLILSDLWLQAVAVISPQLEEDLNPSRVEYATLSLNVGLIFGATIWGCLADVIGRKTSWQITLFIAVRVLVTFRLGWYLLNQYVKGTFGIAAGGAPNFVILCALIACAGFGVGGKWVGLSSYFFPSTNSGLTVRSLPVDGKY